jgi:hypothetical protein
MIIGLSARVGNPGFDAISFVAQGSRGATCDAFAFAELQPFGSCLCATLRAAHAHRMHLRPRRLSRSHPRLFAAQRALANSRRLRPISRAPIGTQQMAALIAQLNVSAPVNTIAAFAIANNGAWSNMYCSQSTKT